MRIGCGWLLAFVAIPLAAIGGDEPQNVVILNCAHAIAGDPACNPSKNDLKKAKAAFDKGLRLQKENHADQALDEFDVAAHLVPKNVEYVTALALAREQLAFDHEQRGNRDLLKGKQIEAQAEFRAALDLDPQNDFARQRLQDSLTEWAPQQSVSGLRVVEDSPELKVAPNPAHHEFHFRGDGRELLTQVAAAYGITAAFDEKVVTHRVHFDMESVDFYTAMAAAGGVTRTFWTPLSENQIIVVPESPENHHDYDQMAVRKFHIPGASTPQDLTDVVNLLRTVFEIKFITQQPQTGTIVVRAPQGVVDAAARFFAEWGDSRPQIMLDMQLFQVSHNMMRGLGLHIPNNFNLFNIPAAALAALGGQSIQSLVNQLISGGGINQANSQSISGLLAQLQGQQNSIFSQPLATFGGGLTFMGLSLDQVMAQLSLNQSMVKTLDHATFRVGQGNQATFKVGERYPILNASFAPVFNSAAISSVLQNGSFQAPFPSFSYEDIGLIVKAKPVVNSNAIVSLELEMQLRAIEAQSFNGVPVIGNREYKGSISLVDGEPAVVAGELSQTEERTLGGIPGLGAVPLLNHVLVTNNVENDTDEMLLVITPHIVREGGKPQDTLVWLPKN